MFELAASVPGRPSEKTQTYFNNLHHKRVFFKRETPSCRVFFHIFSARRIFLLFFDVLRGFAFE